VPPQSCRVIAVRAATGHPVLVSTSRHVTQGIVDVLGEKWSSSAKTLSGTSQVIGGDPYELRIAGLDDGNKSWMLESASLSVADQAAGVTIVAKPIIAEEPGWLRVLIQSEQSRYVNWLLKVKTRSKS